MNERTLVRVGVKTAHLQQYDPRHRISRGDFRSWDTTTSGRWVALPTRVDDGAADIPEKGWGLTFHWRGYLVYLSILGVISLIAAVK